MLQETEISIEASAAAELNPKYDAVSKVLFMNKEIIAPVLKNAVPEYRNSTIDEVIACIDGKSIVSDPVDDVSAVLGDSNSNQGGSSQVNNTTAADSADINAMPTEMSSVSEKLIRYDVRFKAVNPKLTTETIRFYLHIDLEIQNDYAPGYPVIKRAIYYAAREISSQLGILTHEKQYGALEKVYSIWICNSNIPEKIQNTVTSYTFTKSDIIGKTDEPEEDYDLMTVIMIRRGNDDGIEAIFDYLTGVFNSDKEKVSRYIDIDRNPEVKEAFEEMSGLGMSIATKNYNIGMKQGMQQGIKQGMQQGMQQGMKQGMQQGELAKAISIAMNMIYENYPLNVISGLTGLSLEKVQELTDGRSV